VISNTKGKKFTFPCRRWFDKTEDDKMIGRDLVLDGVPGRLHCYYRITVITGTEKGAGTDSNVSISMIGTLGKLDKTVLDNEHNNFETGHVDKFKIATLDLGDLKSITIGHDGKGIGSDWQLDKVMISCEETAKRWIFPCNKWIGSGKDDGKMERTLTPGDTSKTTFFLRVWTGKEPGAGTDANVYCNIIGTTGETGKIELTRSLTHMNKFEAGHVDEFVFDSKAIGKITHLFIGHDGGGITAGLFGGKGVSSAWMMDHAEITDQLTGSLYTVPCNQWFDKKKRRRKTREEITRTIC